MLDGDVTRPVGDGQRLLDFGDDDGWSGYVGGGVGLRQHQV